jgi:hypothetical protein
MFWDCDSGFRRNREVKRGTIAGSGEVESESESEVSEIFTTKSIAKRKFFHQANNSTFEEGLL